MSAEYEDGINDYSEEEKEWAKADIWYTEIKDLSPFRCENCKQWVAPYETECMVCGGNNARS